MIFVFRFHEFEIRRQCPEVFVIRRTLTQMADEARLDEVRLNLGNNGKNIF